MKNQNLPVPGVFKQSASGFFKKNLNICQSDRKVLPGLNRKRSSFKRETEKKAALLLSALFLPVLLGGCSSYRLSSDQFTSELGKDVFANPRLYVENGENLDLSNAEINALSPGIAKERNRFVTSGLDYLEIGEYQFVLQDGKKEYPFSIKVVDSQPPTSALSPSSITVSVNQQIDWSEVFQASDLSGVFYEGPSDITSAPGTYDVTVSISDRFKNTSQKALTVVVE